MDLEHTVASLWNSLDYAVDEIQSPKAPPRDVAGMPNLNYRPEMTGEARGLAKAISLVTGRNFDEVRAEAYERWLLRED